MLENTSHIFSHDFWGERVEKNCPGYYAITCLAKVRRTWIYELCNLGFVALKI